MTGEQPTRAESAEAEPMAASTAWAPFWRLLRIVGLCALLAVLAALGVLQATGAPARWELWLAVAGGVGGTVLLSGALMGLVFVSNSSGHDRSVGRSD
ncbi:hypothetical protein [Sandarakinorhabdus sp. AAP62]|uniref:hypothetical protein n=1 Tax=Sandarakinorhabdus sp. AAP62 TaxID=1248916 RepID=UPI0003159E1C|nr:hypothetical protein [Sandarakinorhabdus sp. AAP62]